MEKPRKCTGCTRCTGESHLVLHRESKWILHVQPVQPDHLHGVDRKQRCIKMENIKRKSFKRITYNHREVISQRGNGIE